MSSMSIGISGLMVNQRLLEMTGQNIANASTPGYHRQVAVLAPRVAGTVGTGVEIQRLDRIVDRFLEDAMIRNTFAGEGNQALLEGLNKLQAYLAPGDGSLQDVLNRFYNEAEKLTTQPDNIAQRRVVLSGADAVADQLNSTIDGLNQIRADARDQANTTVGEINNLAAEIARLNQQARDASIGGQSTNEILDLRDRALSKLSELVDIRTVPQDYGQINVIAAGIPIILNSSAVPLRINLDANNQLQVYASSSNQSIDVAGGKLAGLLKLHNNVVPAVRESFDAFAHGLITQLDGIHATGLSMDGPMTNLASERVVTSPGLPLSLANLSYPPQAGDLYITVTDFATGDRSLHRIAFDPATQNLSDLATSIVGIPHLNAVVDPAAGTLTMLTQSGYGFDFTGSLSTAPDAQTITGTTTADIAGKYTGPINDTLDFRFVGNGTIGATPNLSLEVRNGAGTLIKTFNVGLGYEAGTPLADVLGVKVSLTTGTVNNGDSFQLNVAADADSAKLLPALGLNTFFVGDDSSGLRVRPDLLDHPERMALSTTGQHGDGGNLSRMLAQRDARVLDNNTQSLAQYLSNLIGDVGSQVQDAEVRQSAFDSLGTRINEQLQSVSGVDPNEELLRVVQYQRAYQMSARFITAVNETLDELIRLV